MHIETVCQHFSNCDWPEFLALENAANRCTLSLFIRPTIRWFIGHFPGTPVLPGVVQTHWAVEISQYLFSFQGNFMRIDNLKFHTIILPNQHIKLQLEQLGETNSLRFRYERDEILCSEGKLIFSQS